ncbi:hypothetical protein TWF132_004614 [Orbilia oligospora]|nr:hypothetical protein TWF132_004614 [Orbilia oligospora]
MHRVGLLEFQPKDAHVLTVNDPATLTSHGMQGPAQRSKKPDEIEGLKVDIVNRARSRLCPFPVDVSQAIVRPARQAIIMRQSSDISVPKILGSLSRIKLANPASPDAIC